MELEEGMRGRSLLSDTDGSGYRMIYLAFGFYNLMDLDIDLSVLFARLECTYERFSL